MVGQYLLENNLLEAAISCDGEPAPDRVFPAILPEFRPPDMPNGDRRAEPAEASFGEVLAVGEVDRACVADC
jgi:hypothetical protein